MAAAFTLIDDGTTHTLPADCGGGSVALPPAAVSETLGWELRPEGLCREHTCIPVHDRATLLGTGGLDLTALAAALGRPLALDLDERTAYLGVGAGARGRQLASLEAPDVTLPDLDGTPHTLSDLRGRKVLLVAYASW